MGGAINTPVIFPARVAISHGTTTSTVKGKCGPCCSHEPITTNKRSSFRRYSSTCGQAMVIEHNGDIYSCDHFVDENHFLGNILKVPIAELVNSERQRQFGRNKRETLPKYCRKCQFLFSCHGECPKNRFHITPDNEPGLNYLCDGYQRFFSHIREPMEFMVQELSCGRAPANVMKFMEGTTF